MSRDDAYIFHERVVAICRRFEYRNRLFSIAPCEDVFRVVKEFVQCHYGEILTKCTFNGMHMGNTGNREEVLIDSWVSCRVV